MQLQALFGLIIQPGPAIRTRKLGLAQLHSGEGKATASDPSPSAFLRIEDRLHKGAPLAVLEDACPDLGGLGDRSLAVALPSPPRS